MTQSAGAWMHVDPYSDEFQQSPFAAYAALRATAPVYQVPDHGFYLITTHALVREVLHDPVTYANSVSSARRTEPPPEIAAESAKIKAQGFASQSALGLSDPPRHPRYRKLVQRAFIPRALAWMDPIIAKASRDLVAALPAPGTVDIVRTLAWPVPVYAISRILGLPDSWHEDIGRWSDAATASLGAKPLEPERWLQTERDIIEYQRRISAELDERRAVPRDDMLSVLVQPDPDEGALTNAELVWFVRELMVAGNETTTKLLTDMVLRLSARPETLGGVALPEGAVVFLSFISANRDETVFESPDEFNPDRRNVRHHLSFGQGIHACLGNVLARMEAAPCLREVPPR